MAEARDDSTSSSSSVAVAGDSAAGHYQSSLLSVSDNSLVLQTLNGFVMSILLFQFHYLALHFACKLTEGCLYLCKKTQRTNS